MNRQQTAATYELAIERAVRLVEFYSGRNWSAARQHDPGLTALQILVNALELARERNADLLAAPQLFAREESAAARWKELPPEKPAINAAPADGQTLFPISGAGGEPAQNADNAGQVLVFRGGPLGLEPADFEAMPASRADILASVERIPGLLKAWLPEDEPEHGRAADGTSHQGELAGTERRPGAARPELLLEFAPVLSLELPESLSAAGRIRQSAALAALDSRVSAEPLTESSVEPGASAAFGMSGVTGGAVAATVAPGRGNVAEPAPQGRAGESRAAWAQGAEAGFDPGERSKQGKLGKHNKPGRQNRHKRRILREAARLLGAGRGLCQPVLGCRAARTAPLALEISLELQSSSGAGSRFEIYRPGFQAALASIILALGACLRQGAKPRKIICAADLLHHLRGDGNSAAALAVCGLKLMGLRLEPDLPESGKAAPFEPAGTGADSRGVHSDNALPPQPEAGPLNVSGSVPTAGGETGTRALPPGFDCFRLEAPRFSLTCGGRREPLPGDCVRQAVFLAERQLLDELWRTRWAGSWRLAASGGASFGPGESNPAERAGPSGAPFPSGSDSGTDFSASFGAERSSDPVTGMSVKTGPATWADGSRGSVRQSAATQPLLYEQFPEIYGLKRLFEEAGSASGPEYDPASALQLHGWLLLFERLLAEAREPLEQPERYFTPDPAPVGHSAPEPAGVPEELSSGAYDLLPGLPGGGALSARQQHSPAGGRFHLERRRNLLLHLAALQGEEPWFDPEDLRLEDELGRALPPERAERYNRLLAVWLRALPRLNGRRLLRRWRDGGNFLESGGLSPLEERISMLLLPYQAAAACKAAGTAGQPYGAAGSQNRAAGEASENQSGDSTQSLDWRNCFEMRKTANGLTGRDEYRCYIRDARGRLRIVCTQLAPTPEQAELVAAAALRLAALPVHYHVEQGRVRIGWLAELHLPEACAESKGAASGGQSRQNCPDFPSDKTEGTPKTGPGTRSGSLRREVRRAVEWARSLLPPWVCVLDYSELGEARPFELAVLAEAELVPPRRREAVEARIRAHVPAHLLPRVFFVSPEQRRRADALLHAPDSANYESLHLRYSGLLDLLRELEAASAGPGGENASGS